MVPSPLKLSEVKKNLSARAIHPSRALGQNFLHDESQLIRIAEAGDVSAGDRVLEIGPGLGALTSVLLDRGAEVFGIERDVRLVEFLSDRFRGCGSFRIECADAVEVLRKRERDWSDWKLVSNLPYSAASPMLVELAQDSRRPKRMAVTLQDEVAGRICASPGGKDYGLLTLILQLRYQPDRAFRIPPECFFPEPEVQSACVTLVRRPEALLTAELEPRFDAVVKRAFSQRRKMVKNLLKAAWPMDEVESALKKLGAPSGVRAERLALEQFVELTRILWATTP